MDASVGNLRRAVVVGSSGATGREVVKELMLKRWEVTTIARSQFDFPVSEAKHPDSKLTQIQSNFSSLDEYVGQCNGFDAMFNCLGTTRGQAGSAEAFVEVEVGLTKKACDFAKKAGIRHIAAVTAQGANKDIWVPTTLIHPLLYTRTLGEKQQAVLDAQLPSTSIFQPGMLNRLLGDRMWENVAVALIPSISLSVNVLAKAMIHDAEQKLDALDAEQETCAARVSYFTGNYNIEKSLK
jgi:oxidoreductase